MKQQSIFVYTHDSIGLGEDGPTHQPVEQLTALRATPGLDTPLVATVGLITIEQTDIVRVLSIAATIFLPPTLIASLYGMNFANMPELTSPFGYPLVLVAMLLSVVVPLVYFRRKGWM